MIDVKKVVIIDDSKEILEALKNDSPVDVDFFHIHKPPFYNSIVSSEIHEFSPDLIVLDLLLDKTAESGLRVLREIRTDNYLKELPIIVISKYIFPGMDKYRKKALLYGATDAISKIPFPDFETLSKYANSPAA